MVWGRDEWVGGGNGDLGNGGLLVLDFVGFYFRFS